MDYTYIWMLAIFLIILFCDYKDKQLSKNTTEHFGGFNKNEPYFQERNLVSFPTASNDSSINFNNKNVNFKNFGTDGVAPPYMKCPMCKLQFDCTSYPYKISEQKGNICTTCIDRVYMNQYNFPVLARANGRPRVCRNLN